MTYTLDYPSTAHQCQTKTQTQRTGYSFPQPVHLPALTHGSPDRVNFDPDGLKQNKKIRTYDQNNIQNKHDKKKDLEIQ